MLGCCGLYVYFLISVDGSARFLLINPENEYERSAVGKKIAFLWKTDVFKGSVQVQTGS